MLSAILFFMLGIRLHMGISYYLVLMLYAGVWVAKTVWGLIKDDYITDEDIDVDIFDTEEDS